MCIKQSNKTNRMLGTITNIELQEKLKIGEEILVLNNIKNITLRLTKPKKKGRPSKKDREVYDKTHILNLPEGTTNENLLKALQNEADRIGLPIKFITT